MSVHTIFVPYGCSIEQVWEAMKRGDKITVSGNDTKGNGFWVNVDDKGKVIRP